MKNWNDIKNGLSLSQRVLDKVVKPESALKNKISSAQSVLQIQISKLEGTHKKLQDNHDRIFKKIVDAQKSRDESKARSYAIEFAIYLRKNGIFVHPIRYPTVPKNQARIRISITALLTKKQIKFSLDVFDKARKKFQIG